MDAEQYYDEKAPYYDGEYKTPFYELYNAITWDNITRFLPETGTILDAGGGTGEWTVKLAEQGFNVVLTDISKGMLRQARHKVKEKGLGNVTIKRADITIMSCFKDNTFDMVIVQGDPISYCGNPEKAVKEVYRVLKHEKYCVASVDSKHHIILKLLSQKRWDLLDTILKTGLAPFKGNFTIQYFSPSELKKLFEDAGFEVVRILGKPVFLSLMPREKTHNLLENPNTFQKVLELELNYCDDPDFAGGGGHLEIVGKKN
ncbi:MAG: methyltransferase domain-containing protein [Candidatus Methanofastidiosia archaeon]|jgi:ubiquinone/menaquinone biosynthesis C-methylase UbiE